MQELEKLELKELGKKKKPMAATSPPQAHRKQHKRKQKEKNKEKKELLLRT